MPCTSPLRAWRAPNSNPVFREPVERRPGTESLQIPCGKCLSCRLRRAQDWSVRCGLELTQHRAACWATLTYNEKYCPPTLSKFHVSGFVKRLRKRLEGESSVRFFASGEYGERYGRPHYHIILFGTENQKAISSAWRQGIVQVDTLTPAAIAYVAGYCAKKVGQSRFYSAVEMVDPSTGEVYTHQDPFILMSRKPGIGAGARDQFWRSWRDHAIWHGREVPVPRYLHEGFKRNATPEEVEALSRERAEFIARLDNDPERLKAAAAIALHRHSVKSERRKL